uniref:Putative response regulator receiver protein n=1 Tax=Magnetococcus massalia (strain MO-1) TaxID=451514 RepID=A0A1S7LJX7_MAGMO|nr:Putative response regulator receiver protein [Candidatus Magnetococcus massalia]
MSSSMDSDTTSQHVLVVEDDPLQRDLLLAHLQQLGCQTTSSADGYAALITLYQAHFDLVLLDLSLPDMDGFETAKRMRQVRDASGQLVPIYAMTARSEPILHSKARAAGLNGLITKPVSQRQLEQLLSGAWREIPQGSQEELPQTTEAVISLKQRATTDAQPLLNEAYWQRICGALQPEALHNTLTLFQQAAPEYLQHACEALQEQDIERATQQLHKLAGSSASVGLSRLEQRVRAAERALLAGHIDPSADDPCPQLRQTMAESLKALQQALARLFHEG